MAFSIQRAVSDGTMTLLPVSIEYFDRSEIQVAFDDVVSSTGWSWVGVKDKTLAFSPAVPKGVKVSVIRTTDLSELRHQYALGAQFTAESMDESFKQVLHIAQEAAERQLGGEFFTDVNMHGYQIQNLGPATAPDHAVTLKQYRDDASGASASKDIAVAAAASASSSASAASASAASAAASAGAASASASSASASKSAAEAAASSASTSASTATTKAAEAVVSASDAAASAAAASISETNAASSAATAVHPWEVEGGGIHYDSGNVRIGGVGARITGDFSNATLANRTMFQTSTENSGTNISIIPNGTVATGSASANIRLEDSTSIATGNGSFGGVLLVQDTDFRIQSSRLGTGTYLPITFWTYGSEKLRIGADAGGTYTFGGTSPRIRGDFSNATVANRVMFQTSTVNANTAITIAPNGTNKRSEVQSFTGSTANESAFTSGIDGSAAITFIASDRIGTSPYLPMTFYTGGSERVRIGASGPHIGINTAPNAGWGTSLPALEFSNAHAIYAPINGINIASGIYTDGATGRYLASGYAALLNVNRGYGSASIATYPSGSVGNVVGPPSVSFNLTQTDCVMTTANGGLGYGTGAGGTVTQATSKSTAVTLNRPTGRIVMNNAGLASGTGVWFTFNNSLIAATDVVLVTIASGASPGSYTTQVVATAAGSCVIMLVNRSAGALSEAVVLNFAIIKGAIS